MEEEEGMVGVTGVGTTETPALAWKPFCFSSGTNPLDDGPLAPALRWAGTNAASVLSSARREPSTEVLGIRCSSPNPIEHPSSPSPVPHDLCTASQKSASWQADEMKTRRRRHSG